jgi:regulator of sigma E protease
MKNAKVTKGEIRKGDRMIAFGVKPVEFSTDLLNIEENLKDTTVAVTFLRNNTDTVQVDIYYNKKGNSAIAYKSIGELLGSKQISYSFFEAIPAGINRCWETLAKYVRNLKQLFTSSEVKVRDSLGSVISIGNIFPGEWDWQAFWTFTAVFSIILAFMNVLPIPALDGGHALFTLIEMITGKKPGDKFMEYAQMVGMILLLGLMAYALGLDIWRLFK